MTGKIINKFMQLKEKREKSLGETISLERIAEETGIAYTTIHRYAKGYVTRYDDGILIKLCDYFKISLNELLEYIPE